MRKSRARASRCLHVVGLCVCLLNVFEVSRAHGVSSSCVRPREIPGFDIMETAVSTCQLCADLYGFRKTFPAVAGAHLGGYFCAIGTTRSDYCDEQHAECHVCFEIMIRKKRLAIAIFTRTSYKLRSIRLIPRVSKATRASSRATGVFRTRVIYSSKVCIRQ